MEFMARCRWSGRAAAVDSAVVPKGGASLLKGEERVGESFEHPRRGIDESRRSTSETSFSALTLSGSKAWMRRPLPRNDFTPNEMADALDLLTDGATTCARRARVVWSNGVVHDVSSSELRRLVDPERVVRISVDAIFEGHGDRLAPLRVHGDFIRPAILGIERRGWLTVDGGGTARASFNAAVVCLSARRPGVAAVRRALTGPAPSFFIVLAVGLAFVLTSALVLDRPQAPPFFSRATLIVYAIDAVLAFLYYMAAWSFLGGTRLVKPSIIAGRTWLTSAVVIGLFGVAVSVVALLAPAIGAAVAVASSS